MAHPQNSPRGLFAKGRVHVGSSGVFFTGYSTTTALLDANSTSLKVTGGIQVSGKTTSKITGNSTGIVLAGGIKLSNKSTAVLTGNSTGVKLTGALYLSNKTTAKITGNSTGIIVPALKLGTWSTIFTVNTTGIKLGSRYVSTNTTGNSAT